MTLIHVPRARELILPEVMFGVEGFYHFEKLKDGVVIERRRQHNLITNRGLNRILSLGGPQFLYGAAGVGTGTTPPAVTDTALVSGWVNFSNRSETFGVVTSSPRYGWRRITYTWNVGLLNGNYSEVMINNAISTENANAFSRELIRDNEGDPSVISIASDEQLRLIYELRFYINESDVVTEGVPITGAPDTPYDVTTRRLDVTDASFICPGAVVGGLANFHGLQANFPGRLYSGTLAAITATAPGGTNLGASTSITAASYTDDSFYRDWTFVWGPGTGNGSVRTINSRFGAASLQHQLDTAFTKTSDFSFAFSVRVGLQRYSP